MKKMKLTLKSQRLKFSKKSPRYRLIMKLYGMLKMDFITMKEFHFLVDKIYE